MNFTRIAIIGLGLLGGSIGLAVREFLPDAATTGYDRDPDTRRRAGIESGGMGASERRTRERIDRHRNL